MDYISLIIGNDHHNTLGVVESLGQKGIHSHLIIVGNIKESYVSKSKYVDQVFYAKDCIDMIDVLLKNYSKSGKKCIVIATCDDIAMELNNRLNELSSFCKLPGIPIAGLLKKIMNKQSMTILAQNIGLTVPKTLIFQKGGILPENIPIPCITKSIVSAGYGKVDLNVFYSLDSIKDFLLNKCHSEIIQIQEFIEKDFEFQLLGCSLNCGENIVIPGHTVIKRPSIDNTCFLSYVPFDASYGKIVGLCKRFISEVNYSGTFSMEFIRGKNGKDYFLEMNYRNDGNGICVTSAGTNLPYIWYLYNTGGDYIYEIKTSSVKEVRLIPEYFDLLRVFYYNEISFKEWIKNMRSATCYTTYFKDDKKPFFVFMKQNMIALMKSLINKL